MEIVIVSNLDVGNEPADPSSCPAQSLRGRSNPVFEVLGCHLTAVAYLGGGCPPVQNPRYTTAHDPWVTMGQWVMLDSVDTMCSVNNSSVIPLLSYRYSVTE